MTEPNRRLNIQLALEKSGQEMHDCQTLLTAGSYAGAIGHAYYAAFHAARALLLSQGEEPRTHGGLNSRLNFQFVRSRRLTPEVANLLTILQAQRERSTYDPAAVFTEGMAREAADDAAQFVEAAGQWLQAEGWQA